MKSTHMVLSFLVALLSACGGSTEHADQDESAGGEEHDLSAYQGPVAGDAAQGATVFASNCAGCHVDGRAPRLDGIDESTAEVRYIVRNGEGHMPAFAEDSISGADLENLLAHLQTMGMFAAAE